MSRAARAEQAWRSEWSADILVRNRANDSMERGHFCPQPCERRHGARTFLSATVRTTAWSADISVRNRANDSMERGHFCPQPCERQHGARTFLSATVRAPAWEAAKNLRAPIRVHELDHL